MTRSSEKTDWDKVFGWCLIVGGLLLAWFIISTVVYLLMP